MMARTRRLIWLMPLLLPYECFSSSSVRTGIIGVYLGTWRGLQADIPPERNCSPEHSISRSQLFFIAQIARELIKSIKTCFRIFIHLSTFFFG